VEVALHDIGQGGVAIQPRVVAKTTLIERQVITLGNMNDDESDVEVAAPRQGNQQRSDPNQLLSRHSTDSERRAHSSWWEPIVSMSFDDPDQQPPRLFWKNNTRTPMPWPGTWLTTWTSQDPDGNTGIALSGYEDNIDEFWRAIRAVRREIQSDLPEGTSVESGRFGISLARSAPIRSGGLCERAQ
jgi:hypothetical protein